MSDELDHPWKPVRQLGQGQLTPEASRSRTEVVMSEIGEGQGLDDPGPPKALPVTSDGPSGEASSAGSFDRRRPHADGGQPEKRRTRIGGSVAVVSSRVRARTDRSRPRADSRPASHLMIGPSASAVVERHTRHTVPDDPPGAGTGALTAVDSATGHLHDLPESRVPPDS